ncbi:MAG: 6,7-dimethyl-8-ribityllumazine synthase [Acidaminobacteraceae bacterium]
MSIIQGSLVSKSEGRVALIVSRFNEFITSKLLSGALDGLTRHGFDENMIDIVWVPGAFEIPLIAKKIIKKDQYIGAIALGAVIRGNTSHYDYVCNEVTKGVASVSLEIEKPLIFGVVTTENIEQAIERAGTKAGNKGFDSALTLIEMLNLLDEFK